MKRNSLIPSTAASCVALLLLAFGASLHAEESVILRENLPTISVAGSSEVKIAPDQVSICFGVQTRRSEILAATTELTKRIDSVRQALRDFGIENKDIRTDYLSVDVSYHDDANLTVKYHQAQNQISVLLREPGKLPNLLTTAIAAGANVVRGVDFRHSELRKYRDQARVAACQAAREKATLLAGTLDARVGRVQTITENFGSFQGSLSQNSMQTVSSSGDDGGGMALGLIGISATVQVSFLLEPMSSTRRPAAD